jgi:hypothetical protein
MWAALAVAISKSFQKTNSLVIPRKKWTSMELPQVNRKFLVHKFLVARHLGGHIVDMDIPHRPAQRLV